ncbi:hypothetical protein, partial [uncultured Christiangramia sp.]
YPQWLSNKYENEMVKNIDFLKREPKALKLMYALALLIFIFNAFLFIKEGEINGYLTITFNLILIIFIIRLAIFSSQKKTID